MVVFIKKNYNKEYRREFVEECFGRYLKFCGENASELPGEAKGKNDKPYFPSRPDVRFSLSHSDNYAILAMGETEIGCDIEKIRDINYKPIVNRWFFGGEIEAADSVENYFSVWTKKEAYLKLTADGLSGIRKFDVTGPLEFEGKPVVLTSVDFIPGFKGAIAAEAQEIVFEDVD